VGIPDNQGMNDDKRVSRYLSGKTSYNPRTSGQRREIALA